MSSGAMYKPVFSAVFLLLRGRSTQSLAVWPMAPQFLQAPFIFDTYCKEKEREKSKGIMMGFEEGSRDSYERGIRTRSSAEDSNLVEFGCQLLLGNNKFAHTYCLYGEIKCKKRNNRTTRFIPSSY